MKRVCEIPKIHCSYTIKIHIGKWKLSFCNDAKHKTERKKKKKKKKNKTKNKKFVQETFEKEKTSLQVISCDDPHN